MFKILKYLEPRERILIAVSLVFILASVWLDLKLPEYMEATTKLVQIPGSAVSDIWTNGAMMLMCALGSFASTVTVGLFAARISSSYSARLREALFCKVESFSMEEISRFSTASLITRSTNDVTQVQILIAMALQLLVKAPIMAVWALAKIAGKGLEWSLATGVGVLVILVTVTLLFIFVLPKFRVMQTLTDNITRVTRENLTGLRVVRAFNAESYQEAKFEKANDAMTGVQLFTGRAMSAMWPVMSAVVSGLSLSIYWIGAYLIDGAAQNSRLDIFSNMVVFSQYAMQVIMSFMMLIMMFVMAPRAGVSAKRINEVLDTVPSVVDGPGLEDEAETARRSAAGQVEFRNVSFKYPGAAAPVLDDVSFTAQSGETVAFIGSTGSGKSTLINLVPRFYDATAGEVLVDGVNVKEYKQAALRDIIGYVPQKATLFSGSVRSNVAFGDNGKGDMSDGDISDALRTAQADGFVAAMEGGIDSSVSQGGVNMSGGQKQRIAIARAVCRKPEILIFDDSFSALDYKTDRELRDALRAKTDRSTSLIVAQRIGTIMDADKIVVLDEGKVVGIGKHRELLKNCPVYREIASTQLSDEEMAS